MYVSSLSSDRRDQTSSMKGDSDRRRLENLLGNQRRCCVKQYRRVAAALGDRKIEERWWIGKDERCREARLAGEDGKDQSSQKT